MTFSMEVWKQVDREEEGQVLCLYKQVSMKVDCYPRKIHGPWSDDDEIDDWKVTRLSEDPLISRRNPVSYAAIA